MCGYCATQFIYEPKDFHTKMVEEKEILNLSMKESFRQRDERIEKEALQREEWAKRKEDEEFLQYVRDEDERRYRRVKAQRQKETKRIC